MHDYETDSYVVIVPVNPGALEQRKGYVGEYTCLRCYLYTQAKGIENCQRLGIGTNESKHFHVFRKYNIHH